MRASGALAIATAALVLAPACETRVEAPRRLSSFEVSIETPVGSPAKRCPLPGTPTTAIDLTGCPSYAKDAAGRTVAVVQFSARAIDTSGKLLEDFDGLAKVVIVPGEVEARFTQVRFTNGQTGTASVTFRAAFGDTYLWIVDDVPPPRDTSVAGLGAKCGFDADPVCAANGLTCVNTKPEVGFDPQGLAYCTRGCTTDADCPAQGYFCGSKFVAYAARDGAELPNGACMRHQPSYAAGAAGPMHLVEPNLADISRSLSLNSSPFEEDFIQVQRGKMVVTAIRVDGFYVTDVCPLAQAVGGPTPEDPDCSDDEKAAAPEFNHLFVFNFSRPEDLVAGDELLSLAGPIVEFIGLTEMSFPLWEVDYAARPTLDRDRVKPVNLQDQVNTHFPHLLVPGERCALQNQDPHAITLLHCDFAMERLEAGRVTAKILRAKSLDERARMELERFGQWPVIVNTGLIEREFRMVTRENLPFFDPSAISGKTINATVTGNLRQVSFDDERGTPIWILEPRDQADCPWCVNP